jgi:disulfide bond formation protein DsbB
VRSKSSLTQSAAYRLGAMALLIAAVSILAALGFEHLGGYAPCPLCLMERWAYYGGIPVLFMALIALTAGHKELAIAGLVLVALGFLANMALGGYHAGAEWGFWPGPSTCSGDLKPLGSPADLLKGLKAPAVVRCDQAGWRMFGLSFAGWNAVISALLWITCLRAALYATTARRA